MASQPSPAFLFYIKDWRSSRKVQAMNFATRGMYLEMLIEQWDTGSVPGSPHECASLLGGTKTEWQRAWPKLRASFTTKFLSGRSVSNGRLVNVKLEQVRLDRLRYKKAKRESGLLGAKARWKRHGEPMGVPSAPATPSAMANDGLSFSSSFALASADKDSAPQPRRTARVKASRECLPQKGDGLRELFEAFWKVYPKKVGKDAAWRAWQKRRPSLEVTQQICASLAWQKRQDNWLRERGRFVPNPATWIARGQWQDEPSETPLVNDSTLAISGAMEDFLKS